MGPGAQGGALCHHLRPQGRTTGGWEARVGGPRPVSPLLSLRPPDNLTCSILPELHNCFAKLNHYFFNIIILANEIIPIFTTQENEALREGFVKVSCEQFYCGADLGSQVSVLAFREKEEALLLWGGLAAWSGISQ